MKKKAIRILALLLLCAGTLLPALAANTGLTAVPTSSSVIVDGKTVAFDAYNVEGNNYFKLRDLAYVLSGTDKQFAVAWDSANNAISLTSGMEYTPVGGEMTAGASGNKTAVLTTSKIYLNGDEAQFTAYNIAGNNYFKLRDIGGAFDFGVTWDGAKNTIVIDTSRPYTPENTAVPANKTGNTPGNINNGGFAAIQGDTIYCLNSGDFYIYSMKADGSDERKLNNNRSFCINVVGDTIYYINMDDGFSIYGMNLDGGNRRKLGSDAAARVTVIDSMIYYINDGDGSGIYSMRTDGSGRQKVSGDYSVHLNVAGDTIYYVSMNDGRGIYSMKTDGSGKKKLADGTAYHINVVGDRIYYIDGYFQNNRICSMKTDGSDVRQIYSGGDARNANVSGDRIYYYDREDYGIHSIKLDGSDRRKIVSDDEVRLDEEINVTGGWLYFTKGNDTENDFEMFRIKVS